MKVTAYKSIVTGVLSMRIREEFMNSQGDSLTFSELMNVSLLNP